MSLTSYQAAPPRAMKIVGTSILCKSKNGPTWTKRICLSSHRDFVEKVSGKILVGTASWSDPGFVERWYPKKLPAGDRLAVVCAAFRFGRSKLDILFRAGAENGGALVRCDAG